MNPRRKVSAGERILVYLVVAVLGTVIVAGAIFYANAAQQRIAHLQEEVAEQPLAPVKVIRVFPVPMEDWLVLPGTVQAREDIRLAVRRPGTIAWIGPEEGDRVEKGQKLLELDQDQLKAEVDRARTTLELARIKFERQKRLYEENVGSVEALDDARASVDTARASLELAEANLADATIFAPISGMVDRLPVDVGEHLAEGETVMQLVDIEQVEIEVEVPEKDILYFEPGLEVPVATTGAVELAMTGTVEFVALTANPVTRTYPLKILVDNREGRLRPGMIVRASLERRRVEDAIAVPFFTVVDREDGKSVYVVDEDGLAHERRVEFGIFQGGLVEITRGLALGDRLVVVGQRNLVEGQKVRVAADVTDVAHSLFERGVDLSQVPIELLERGIERANQPVEVDETPAAQ